MNIPDIVIPLVKTAFKDMNLDFDKVTPDYQELDSGAIYVLYDEQYICSFHQNPEKGHRFDYRLKWKHIDNYLNLRY